MHHNRGAAKQLGLKAVRTIGNDKKFTFQAIKLSDASQKCRWLIGRVCLWLCLAKSAILK
jgi:hypothetical protein